MSNKSEWQGLSAELRSIVLDEIDREGESEDVTNAFQIARRLLWELWDNTRGMCLRYGCRHRAQESAFYCSSACHMAVYEGRAKRIR